MIDGEDAVRDVQKKISADEATKQWVIQRIQYLKQAGSNSMQAIEQAMKEGWTDGHIHVDAHDVLYEIEQFHEDTVRDEQEKISADKETMQWVIQRSLYLKQHGVPTMQAIEKAMKEGWTDSQILSMHMM